MDHPGETYDIIFVGGGAAGCVAAGQLAAANPGLKVLILEAGPHSLNVDTHVQPVRYLANLFNANKLRKSFTLHVAQPSEAVANRKIVVPSGRVLGGGSSVNFMVYTRASASDYDTWEEVHENPGWGSKDLIPLLKQVETYTVPTSNSTHGTDGPIRISYPTDSLNVAQQFLEVVAKYDKDRPVTDDWNDFKTGDAYGIWPKYIDDKTGRRSDTAHHFIYNQAENKNLTVLTESRGVRVVFEGTRAVGVEFIAGDANSPSHAFASKLVVLSAGSFGSPAILERSGIGAQDVLHKNGITHLVDLPGVGERYNDHNIALTHYAVSPEADSVDAAVHGPEDALSPHIVQWKETGKGWMARNGVDAAFKMRPTAEELKTMGPAFEKRWKDFFEAFPDKPVMLGAPMAAYVFLITQKVSLLVVLPASTGSVHIAHGLDPYGPLNFIHSYLDDEADVAVFRWMYKHLREIARRMPFYRGEILDCHPAFPAGSGATCKPENDPVDIDAPKLVYTVEDDVAIDDFHRRTIATAWHALGTCAMKPRDKGGVVDSRLNVYGTTQLKIADLSICPENVGANTYNTALAVGAKAAILIAEDLGLNLRNSKCSL
ncbi:hypothetical protein EST38_g10808 [Candolleomyces aberdarensis]|uniref:pyranose dehydrogenase (acceptor) n=1 Tax=Candolleomyces aberdarensis TaxID=2316362 RepID=A0A4Q2D6F9_9AGAR|nr:hypothetical protein EST38_g10808 [Candolleomyces aberdarensis]